MPTKAKGSTGKEVAKSAPASSLIDGRVSTSQIGKALSALAQHREKAQKAKTANELPLEGDDDLEGNGSRVDRSDVVWMQITVKRLNANAPIKAIRL